MLAALTIGTIATAWFVGVPLVVYYKDSVDVPCVYGEGLFDSTPPPPPLAPPPSPFSPPPPPWAPYPSPPPAPSDPYYVSYHNALRCKHCGTNTPRIHSAALLTFVSFRGVPTCAEGHSTGITASKTAEVYRWLLQLPPVAG